MHIPGCTRDPRILCVRGYISFHYTLRTIPVCPRHPRTLCIKGCQFSTLQMIIHTVCAKQKCAHQQGFSSFMTEGTVAVVDHEVHEL